jgi:hypothetical protein
MDGLIYTGKELTIRLPQEVLDDLGKQIAQRASEIIEKHSMTKPDPQFYSAEKVCEILDIARSTLVQWDKKEITRPIRIGNLKRYLREDIEAMGNDGKYKRSGK